MKTKYLIPLIALVAGSVFLSACGGNDKKAKKKEAKKVEIAIDTAMQSRLKAFGNARRSKGNFGFYVYDLTADKPIYGVNERVAQSSASCMKLLTAVAGMRLLGTRYYYPTSFYTHGKLVGDTLRGDIALKAGFDPQFSPADIAKLVKHLRQKGVKHISGKVYLDLLLKNPVKSEAHWYPWDLAFSRYGILYKGANSVRNEMKRALRAQGLNVADSQLIFAPTPKRAHRIYSFYRCIDLVTQRMFQHSSNTQATALLYTIGYRVNPKAEPTAAGVKYLRSFLRDTLQLRDKSLVVHDGCGLCTHNQLTPVALTTFLRYAYQHKDMFQLMERQLSLSGTNGTLRRQLYQPGLKGKILGKTGTLSHPYGISSLAGYTRTADGHLIAFSIMDTDMSVLDAHVLQEKLCRAILRVER